MKGLKVLDEKELSTVIGGRSSHPKACKWTFTGAGLAHGALYGAAAAALGVAGPAAWIPGAIVGAIYGIADTAFC